MELLSRSAYTYFPHKNGHDNLMCFTKRRIQNIVFSAFLVAMVSKPADALDLSPDKWYVGVFSYVDGQIKNSQHSHAGMKDHHGQIKSSQHSNGLTLGETSIFTRGKLNSRFSLLSEHTLLPRYYREDQFKLERLVLHYEVNESHWFEFGKLYTPVNYWNDWYHHSLLFFPTIERPAFFSDNFFPIPEIGIRVGGLVGYKSLQYDLLVCSGSVAVPGDDGDQIFPNGIQSFNAALI